MTYSDNMQEGVTKRTLHCCDVISLTRDTFPPQIYTFVCKFLFHPFCKYQTNEQTKNEEGVKEQYNSLKVSCSVKFPLTHYPFFWRSMGSHGALNERSYIHLCPLLCVSLPYPLALPSPLSSGSVIDRLQQLRPPTALSSFGDTLSVLIRALIGRLAVGEWHQGLGHGGDTDFREIPFMLLSFSFLSFFPSLSLPFILALMCS